jgi:hypothetical protein
MLQNWSTKKNSLKLLHEIFCSQFLSKVNLRYYSAEDFGEAKSRNGKIYLGRKCAGDNKISLGIFTNNLCFLGFLICYVWTRNTRESSNYIRFKWLFKNTQNKMRCYVRIIFCFVKFRTHNPSYVIPIRLAVCTR